MEHLFVFKGKGVIEDHYCSYTDYRKKLLKSNKESSVKQKKEPVSSLKDGGVKKRTFTERIEYEKLEKEIDKLEKEKTNIEDQLMDSSLDYDVMLEKSNRLGEVMKLIDEKSFRWMELDEIEA